MKIHSIIVALLYPLMLFSCNFYHPETSEEDYRSTVIYHDPFKNITKITGSEHQFALAEYVNLRAWSIGNNMVYQLYVNTWMSPSSGFSYYNSAYSIGGNSLNLTPIAREITSSSSGREIFGIDLSREQLNAAKESGLLIKACGSRGEILISMPSSYIVGFLQKVDEYKK